MRDAYDHDAKNAKYRGVAVCTRNVFYVATVVNLAFTLVIVSRIKLLSQGSVHECRQLLSTETKTNNAAYKDLKKSKLSDPHALQNYLRRRIEDTKEPWWENRNSSRTLYVEVYTGLANILQTMASAYTVAYRENINIKIVFWASRLSPVKWDELFSFPKVNVSVTFPDGKAVIHETKACTFSQELYVWKENSYKVKWVKDQNKDGQFGCTRCCCWREEPFPETVAWFYKILQPAMDVQKYIDNFKKRQKWDEYQWVAVHVRRSDNFHNMRMFMNTKLQKELRGVINTTDADSMLPVRNYVTLMKQLQRSWPKHRVDEGPYYRIKPVKFFLATDNKNVVSQIANEFEAGSVVWFNNNARTRFFIKKSVWERKVAVIELYLLASCDILVGTPFSTFSEAAHLIGGGVYLEPEFAYYNMSVAT
eukprot:g6600.t1